MNNPTQFQLAKNGGAFQIGAAGTTAGDWVSDLEGMLALALIARFAYGGGGTSVTVYIQASLDQGQTAFDIAAIQFTTATDGKLINLSALTPKTTPASPANLTLTPGTCVDGMLGAWLRAVIVVVGTYTGSTLLTLSAEAR